MKNKENFLQKIPAHNQQIRWSQDDNGIVTIEMQNRGIANRIAQLLIKKPKVSYIHLKNLEALYGFKLMESAILRLLAG